LLVDVGAREMIIGVQASLQHDGDDPYNTTEGFDIETGRY